MKKQVKVLYIGGYSRSGSTMFMRLFSQIPKFEVVGELWDIWSRSFRENQLCGCGNNFQDCELWTQVAEIGFGGFDVDIDYFNELRESVHGTKATLMLMFPAFRSKEYKAKHAEYIQILDKFYSAIHETTGCSVIVDSSKVPTYAYLLKDVPSVDLKIVHLVRDSRGSAWSWQRKKQRPEIHWKQEYMERYSLFKSSMEWNIMNGLFFKHVLEGITYKRIRYEDLVASPKAMLKELGEFLDEPLGDFAFFVDEHTVEYSASHTVSGNPNRFKSGKTKIRRDTEWIEKMPLFQKLYVYLLTLPLQLRYKYPINPSNNVE